MASMCQLSWSSAPPDTTGKNCCTKEYRSRRNTYSTAAERTLASVLFIFVPPVVLGGAASVDLEEGCAPESPGGGPRPGRPGRLGYSLNFLRRVGRFGV